MLNRGVKLNKIRILYMGTTDFSAYILEGLLNKGYKIEGVVTQEDKIRGRKKEIEFSPVKKMVLKHNLDLYQPSNIKDENEFIFEKEIDFIVTCAYGQIVPKKVLRLAKVKAINVHASLLPKYRGAAPIEYAILNNEDYTGISIMEMVSKMDAGDVYTQEKIKININENRDDVFEKLKPLALKLLLHSLPQIYENKIIGIKQDESKVTYAPSIKREDEHLDFSNKSIDLYNKIRAFDSIPGAYALLDDQVFKIYKTEIIERDFDGEFGEIVLIEKDKMYIKTLDGALSLKIVKPFSKNKMDIKNFLNGKNNLLGKVLK